MREITKEDFVGYPKEVTEIPMYWGEDAEVFAWGHVDKAEFLSALRDICEYHDFSDGEADDVNLDDIQHRYARPHPVEGFEEDDISFKFCPEGDEDAFPVTFLQL